MRKIPESIIWLTKAGIQLEDAVALRRISMTLHSWGCLECGDSNAYGAWYIGRDEETDKPYMERQFYGHGKFKDYSTRTKIPDREKAALRRLGKILTRYPEFTFYHQTDPRGTALYIIRKADIPEGGELDQYYNSCGIPVSK